MKCVVTAGPTYEPLDEVRRLTNFSTGKLGVELANFLTHQGHEVTLLQGEQSTYWAKVQAAEHRIFTTTRDLLTHLEQLSLGRVDTVFHASAVSDFSFGKVWIKNPDGQLNEAKAGKISTREGILMAELIPTQKIISRLRTLFPMAILVGWKYEVEGGKDGILQNATKQMRDCNTDACVMNGKAWGEGFGILQFKAGIQTIESCANLLMLFNALEKLIR